jgi:RNA polymerase sigma factor (sigma-70 family)
MAADPLGNVVRHIRTLVRAPGADGPSDADLLQGFISRRDEQAFAALVQRHGPMVLGVCRRLLRDPQEAEDAFQATFLVLVRKAGAIGRRELVGNWLYGVAYRIAVRARAHAARRRARRRPLTDMPTAEPPCPLTNQELHAVLDEEVQRLPAKYRSAFVLCCLEGKTCTEAARALGRPKGTVTTWLSRARQRLRTRLVRRGVALSAAALAVGLSREALTAAVPAVLAGATVRAAALTLAGKGAAAGAVSARAAVMAQGAVRALFLERVRVILGLVLLIGLAGAAGGVLQGHIRATLFPAAAPELIVEAPATQAGPEAVGAAPAWSERPALPVSEHTKGVLALAYSRDGKTLATAGGDNTVRLWEAATGRETAVFRKHQSRVRAVAFSADGRRVASVEDEGAVMVWDVGTQDVVLTLDGPAHSEHWALAFTPDGATLLTASAESNTVRLWELPGGRQRAVFGEHPGAVVFLQVLEGDRPAVASACSQGTALVWDPATGRVSGRLQTPGPLGAEHDAPVDELRALSPDGQTAVSCAGVRLGPTQVKLWDVAGGKVRTAFQADTGSVLAVAFTPDGRTLATAGWDGVKLWDAGTGQRSADLGRDTGGYLAVLAFAPDGKTLVVATEAGIRMWTATSGGRSATSPSGAPGG